MSSAMNPSYSCVTVQCLEANSGTEQLGPRISGEILQLIQIWANGGRPLMLDAKPTKPPTGLRRACRLLTGLFSYSRRAKVCYRGTRVQGHHSISDGPTDLEGGELRPLSPVVFLQLKTRTVYETKRESIYEK